MGSRLIPILAARGYEVVALVRPGSESKLPAGYTVVVGDALDGASYQQHVSGCDTFIQLVGVAHPSPAKAKEFVAIDQRSGMEAIHAAQRAGVAHFIYVSVAHPAPAMHAYIAARIGVRGGTRSERAQRYHPAAVVRAGSGTSLALCADSFLLAGGADSFYSRRCAETGFGDVEADAGCADCGGGAAGGGREDRRGAGYSSGRVTSTKMPPSSTFTGKRATLMLSS